MGPIASPLFFVFSKTCRSYRVRTYGVRRAIHVTTAQEKRLKEKSTRTAFTIDSENNIVAYAIHLVSPLRMAFTAPSLGQVQLIS